MAELKTATEELEASKITKESLREELNELQETITGEKVIYLVISSLIKLYQFLKMLEICRYFQ